MPEQTPASAVEPQDSLSANQGKCRVVFVTGPRGAGKTRWLQGCIDELRARNADARVAVLLCEEGRARMETFCADRAGVLHRKLFPSCICCPTTADLPGVLEDLIEATSAKWVFVELPILAAAGLLGEFDRILGWPRSLIVLLTPKWAEMVRSGMVSPFQSALIDSADAVASDRTEAEAIGRKMLSGGVESH